MTATATGARRQKTGASEAASRRGVWAAMRAATRPAKPGRNPARWAGEDGVDLRLHQCGVQSGADADPDPPRRVPVSPGAGVTGLRAGLTGPIRGIDHRWARPNTTVPEKNSALSRCPSATS